MVTWIIFFPSSPPTLSHSQWAIPLVFTCVIDQDLFPYYGYLYKGDHLESISPIVSPSTHVVTMLFFFCVSAPTVLPLNVDIFLSPKSLRIVLDLCIAASREAHYVRLCHSVSVSVYNVLLVLLLSLWLEVIPVHMEFLQFITPLSTIVIPSPTYATICSAIPQSMGTPSFSNFLPPQRVWI